MADKKAKRYSELYPKTFPGATQANIEDVLGKDIVILDILEQSGSRGIFLSILFHEEEDDHQQWFNCGGVVIVEALTKAKKDSNLPLIATIIKDKDYYEIV